MTSYAEKLSRLQEMRRELRSLEASAEQEARDMSPITLDQEREMSNTQSRLDEAYQAAGRRAPPPLPYERPASFHKRLLSGLQHYSDDWRGKSLSGVDDPTALRAIESNLTESARRNGPSFGLQPHEIKPIDRSSGAHKITEFVGGPDAHFTQLISRPPARAQLKSREEYNRISQSNIMARISEVVPRWMRPTVKAPRANF